jgi:hypothetical protein
MSVLSFSSRHRLPLIQQTEAAECGLACLAMIASYYGHRIDLNTLRRRYPVSLKGGYPPRADPSCEPDATGFASHSF